MTSARRPHGQLPSGRLPQSLSAIVVTLALVLTGCGPAQQSAPVTDPSTTAVASSASSASSGPGGDDTTPVRQGHQARPSAAFVPEAISLPGHENAPVVPASTVDGVLAVPENVNRVGWWDGSAEARDPFGSVVIAGHVDSSTQGLGFFSRLLRLRTGERITVSAGSSHKADYEITSVRSVLKDALASDSAAFDQDGDHRLVLITCTGAYIKSRGGYQSNLVVVARPVD